MAPKRKKRIETASARNVRSRPILHRKAKGNIKEEKRKASLMSLPAELRISIYEYALTEENEVTVDATLKQPDLLSTCRQIRLEALEIWYYQNTFYLTITDCDASMVAKFETHLTDMKLDFDKVPAWLPIDINSHKRWRNLMAWCERLCGESSWYPVVSPNAGNPYIALVMAACGIAVHYYETGASWELCQEALGHT